MQPQQGALSYIVDARTLAKPIVALQLQWPDDAAEFAGRMQVEASDDRKIWRKLLDGAPVANLTADGERLIEDRVEFPPTQAHYWRLSWAGAAPSFQLTGVRAEEATKQSEAKRSKLAVNGKAIAARPGEFEFDLGAIVPVDRVNLALPEPNSIVRVELQSRAAAAESWQPVVTRGFYRQETRNGEMRNGPIAIAPTAHRYWLAKFADQGGKTLSVAPRLQVEWQPEPVARKLPWLWIGVVFGVALLLVLTHRLLKTRRRI